MELQERLDTDLQLNHRMAHLLTTHAGTNHGYKANHDQKFPSKSCVLRYGKEKIASDAFRLFERGLSDYLAQYSVSPKKKSGSPVWAITSLFIGASNILATPAGVNPITRFFSSPPANSLQEKVGPSSPSSSSSIPTLDAALPPCKIPGSDGETSSELNLDINELASNVGVGTSTKDMHETDVMCTPTFGQFRHIDASACTLDLPTPGSGMTEADLWSVRPELPQLDSVQITSQSRAFIINCSPVEQELETPAARATTFCEEKKHEGSFEKSNESEISDVPKLSISDVFGKEPELRLDATGSHLPMSGVLKLKDIWDRKESITRSTPNDNRFGVYKQEEIDEAVLSELPAEIQEELYRSLGCKRPRVVKKSTIGDFFSYSAPHRGNKADP